MKIEIDGLVGPVVEGFMDDHRGEVAIYRVLAPADFGPVWRVVVVTGQLNGPPAFQWVSEIGWN